MERNQMSIGELTLKTTKDADGNYLFASGTTVPSAATGYAKGCIFIDTDKSGSCFYLNTGTATSCTFTLVGTIGASSVTLAMLAAGITPAAICVYAGSKTTAGGAASEDITVAGVLATDIIIVTIQNNGTNNVTLLESKAKAGDGAITCVFSGNPGADCVINVTAFRAAA